MFSQYDLRNCLNLKIGNLGGSLYCQNIDDVMEDYYDEEFEMGTVILCFF
jgi:hypothetical protein